MRSTRPFNFNAGFVNWDRYAAAHYTPAPALTKLPDFDSFWRAIGGSGWGFDGEIERERAAAAALGAGR
jgi:hypothetical protein